MSTKQRGKRSLVVVGLLLLMILALTVWSSWKHIRFSWLFEALGNNEQGYPEYRHRKTGIVMVRVPGGAFIMGSPDGWGWSGPQHEVELRPFLIAKHEVTQSEWKKAMGIDPPILDGDAFPARKVSWEDCHEFCRRIGLRLPTEAQWEYACRASTTGPFSGTGKLDDMGWYLENSGDRAHRVGEKKPNAFGLYDMHGNVSEWCDDVFDKEFYKKPEARRRDPVCASGSEVRLLRGGYFGMEAKYCHSEYRWSAKPSVRIAMIGFRPTYYPLP